MSFEDLAVEVTIEMCSHPQLDHTVEMTIENSVGSIVEDCDAG